MTELSSGFAEGCLLEIFINSIINRLYTTKTLFLEQSKSGVYFSTEHQTGKGFCGGFQSWIFVKMSGLTGVLDIHAKECQSPLFSINSFVVLSITYDL